MAQNPHRAKRGRPRSDAVRHRSDHHVGQSSQQAFYFNHESGKPPGQEKWAKSSDRRHSFQGDDGRRGRGRPGRGRGRGNGNGNGNGNVGENEADHSLQGRARGQNPRWHKPGDGRGHFSRGQGDTPASLPEAGPNVQPGIEEPRWQKPSIVPKNPDMAGEELRDTRPKKPRKFNQESRRGRVDRGARGPLPRDRNENQENCDSGRSWTPAEPPKPRPNSEEDSESRNHMSWRAPNRNPQGESRRKPADHRHLRDNWRERHPADKGPWREEKSQRGASPPKSPLPNPEELSQRPGGGRGQGRRTPLQDRGQRHTGGPDPRTAHRRRMDHVPKSKETQTGENE